MVPEYIWLFILLFLTFHLFFLPVSKKRPVFIKGLEGSLFFTLIFAVIAAVTHPFMYAAAIVVGIALYRSKSWIVYGVSAENIKNALERAILATRASSTVLLKGYEIDKSMFVSINYLGMKICYIQYKNNLNSKKSELTKELFRKFIQNYFI